METNVERTKTPGHGRSEVKGSLRIWKASSRGNPQELLEYVPLCAYVELEYSNPYCFGTASKYLTIRPSNPPTLTNPTNDNDPCNARRVFPGRKVFCVQVLRTHYCQDNGTSQHNDGLQGVCENDGGKTSYNNKQVKCYLKYRSRDNFLLNKTIQYHHCNIPTTVYTAVTARMAAIEMYVFHPKDCWTNTEPA